jgi:hypothetical protein
MYGMREVERLGEKAAKAKASRKQAGRWKTGSKSQGRTDDTAMGSVAKRELEG